MADTTTDTDVTTPEANLEWFRSSDQTGQTMIRGLNDGPDRFAFGPKTVTYSVVDGMPLFEGDILLDDLVDLSDPDSASDAPAGPDVAFGVGITGERFRWKNAIFPYQFASGFPHVARVNEAIEELSANTMVQFVRRTAANASDYPDFVEFFSGSGCFSSVGRRGGRQRISLGNGCGTRGIAIHEIMHALGVWHEQSREDRANHVRVNLDNVTDGREHNFNQHIADGDDIGGYDFGSIMHYGRFAFSKNGLPTIETLGGATIRQVSGGRYLDAHESQANDFSAVTRTRQDNDTQLWVITEHPTLMGRYWIQQLKNGRFLDAHQGTNDHSVVTRTAQNNDTQAWTLLPVGGDRFRLYQASSGRLLDAHQGTNDHSAVTRTAQNNDTQEWQISAKGFVCTIQQQSSMRYMDAHTSSANDFSAVTRTRQDNATQRWVVMPSSPDSFTIRQANNGRYLDAHQSSGNDFSVVTRTAQNNDTQQWHIDQV